MSRRPDECVSPLELELTGSCEPPDAGYWDPDAGPQEEQQASRAIAPRPFFPLLRVSVDPAILTPLRLWASCPWASLASSQ